MNIRFAGGKNQLFDKVVIAAHADQALRLLSKPTAEQHQALSAWSYSLNEVVLHTDISFLAPNKRLWCSWNFLQDKNSQNEDPLTVTYYMNRLQQLSTDRHYMVTLNPRRSIHADRIIKKLTYTHPIYTKEAIESQSKLKLLNKKSNILFCGSYFGYGFHEDAVTSALNVVKEIIHNK